MKAIIFDLDGTLVDSRESILSSIRFGLEKIGHKNISFDETKAVQQDLATTLTVTGEKLGIHFSDDDKKAFIHHYREHHSLDPVATMKLYDDVPEVLDHLRSHFSIGIATTKHTVQAKHVLKALKIDEYFEHIQGTDPGMRYKPAPDILLVTMKELCLTGMPAAYVGDSAHDMEAAKAAGMKAIGAAYGFAGADHLKAADPHHMLEAVRELSSLF